MSVMITSLFFNAPATMGTNGVEKIKAADVITKLSASILKIIV
ncbi:MAG: hypothetical protein WA816_07810 [Bacteroidales bacterium]